MVAGLTVAMAGYLVLPLVEMLPADWRAGWLVGTSFVRALGFGLYWVNARPFLMESTRPEERAHAYAAQAAISPLAGFAGSLVAGVLPALFASMLGVSLDHPAPYRYPLWIAAALLAPGVLAIFAMSEPEIEHVEERTRGIEGLPLGLLISLSVAVFLGAVGAGSARSFFNVYLDDGLRVSTSRIGTLSAFGQLAAAAAALSMPLLSARWGNAWAYLVASLGVAVGLLPLALVPHWAAAGLGYLGVMSSAAITLPAINVYQMERVTPRWRTTMSGVTAMANGLSWAITTFVGGYVIAALGYRPLFLAGAGMSIVGALFFWARFCSSRAASAVR
jgi:MFS family permease